MLYIQKYSLRLGIFTFGILSFSILAFNVILNPSKVNAAAPTSESDIKSATFKFIDRANIEATIGGQKYTFFDDNIDDGRYWYEIQGSDCYGRLKFFDTPLDNQSDVGIEAASAIAGISISEVDVDYTFTGPDGCNNTSPGTLTGNVSTNGQYNIWFKWLDSGAIQRVDGRDDETYVKPTLGGVSDRIFLNNSEGKCTDIIIVNTSKTSMKIYRLEDRKPNNADQLSDIVKEDRDLLAPVFDNDKCEVKGTTTKDNGKPNKVDDIIMAKSYLLGVTADANNPAGTGYNGEAAQEDNSCEAKSKEVIGWIMCPLIYAIDGGLNFVDSRIQELLDIDKNYYDNPGIKGAWANIRNIAYIILVPIMLIMVIGTALGFGFVDAYTVKRALPRLLLAVLFITLSYAICVFLIELFGTIGKGTLGLLTTPFRGTFEDPVTNEVITVSNLTLSSLFGESIFTSIGGAIVGAAGGLIILWLFGGTLLLFAGTAFLVLLLRQMFIVALLLVAPLAILAWIFPNNDKLWKSWWSSFSKLLMMFPIIMALIAAGRIFAFIIHTSNPAGLDGTILAPLMKLVAYMIPYAFIPFTFKLAGGVFATATGMISDRSKGLFDRQRKSRATKLERTAGGKMFKGGATGGLRDRLNTAGSSVMHAKRAGFSPRNWRSNVSNAMGATARQQLEKTMQEDHDYALWKGNDTLNAYASMSRNEDELRANLRAYGGYQDEEQMERDIRRVGSVKRKMGSDAFRQMTFLQATAGGTVYDRGPRPNAVTGQRDAALDWSTAMAASSGGDDASLAYLTSQGKSLAMSAGRVDQGGASFNTIFDNARGVRQGQITGAQAMHAIHDNVVESNGAGVLSHASMKPDAVTNLIPAMQGRLQRALESGSQVDYDTELANIANIYDTLSSTSPNKSEILGEGLMSWMPTPDGGTVRQQIERARDPTNPSDAFLSRRRELSVREGEQTPPNPGDPMAPAGGGPAQAPL